MCVCVFGAGVSILPAAKVLDWLKDEHVVEVHELFSPELNLPFDRQASIIATIKVSSSSF